MSREGMSRQKEDEQALNELLADGVEEEFPVLCTAVCLSPTMQQELASLLFRAYLKGKYMGAKK